MAWSTPRTWVVGEIVTAALLNQHLRDNLNAIDALLDLATGSFTNGGILLGNGSGVIQAMAVLAKGSLVVGDGSGAPSELTVGSNGSFLAADSSQATGLRWTTSVEVANPEDVQKFA